MGTFKKGTLKKACKNAVTIDVGARFILELLWVVWACSGLLWVALFGLFGLLRAALGCFGWSVWTALESPGLLWAAWTASNGVRDWVDD